MPDYAEHTFTKPLAIPDGTAEHHAITLGQADARYAFSVGGDHMVVTLDADAEALLSLNIQELGLDTQPANTVLAGPATGAVNEPTFRALVAADLPAATESAQGAVELATTAEAATGTDTERATTPAGLPLRVIGSGWALKQTDGSAPGGNNRGTGAVDLQVTRTADTQIASGTYSAVGGGYCNTASGDYATVGGGYSNTANGGNATVGGGQGNIAGSLNTTVGGGQDNIANHLNATVGGGRGNTASGDYATVGGGSSNTASGYYATVGGGKEGVANKYGQSSQAAGKFAVAGDAQTSILVARKSTTNATPAELFLDGASARCTIATDTSWAFEITVIARRTDADNESAAYQFLGCIDRNGSTTALVGSVAKTVIAEDTAAWDCNVTADDTNDALIITVTGEAGKTIYWVAKIELVEVTG